MNKSFVHLHQHTEFSMLDGAARVGDVVQAVVDDGQPAVGITDHGNMYGVLDFYRACKKVDVNPIIGTEMYMAKQSVNDRPKRKGKVQEDDTGGEIAPGEKLYYHLTMLAETNEGYKNLIKLSSDAYLRGYYYKPRVDWDMLSDHSKGLIVTTGCLGGVVLQAVLNGDDEEALRRAARLQDIFGKDNLFVEIQDHGIAEQARTNPKLFEIAKRIGAPLLLTNDSHYVKREDALPHDALLCIQTKAKQSDVKRFRFQGEEHYLKTAQEMRSLFPDHPEASDNTLWIAERCNVEIEFGKPSLPTFEIPDGYADDVAYLRALTLRGMEKRWNGNVPDKVRDRVEFELDVIQKMGFSSYFLIVWDLMKYARSEGIRVGPGRGSAAGCVVSYCLKITDLDPVEYDLLFERFLNPGRVQMPDIDMDFDDRYREKMIQYAKDKYGKDHVAQIVTFSRIKARSAVRDVARLLDYDYGLGDRIVKAMPPLVMGRDTPLHACLVETEGYEDMFPVAAPLREMYNADSEVKKVVDTATSLEGLRRQDGIHAAAVVITDKPLTEYLPVQRKPEPNQDPDNYPIVTQYEMHGVEDLGLLKMDFLGLTMLSVIDSALANIKETQGIDVDIDHIDLEDPETLKLLQAADAMGVFQCEGGQMRRLMQALAPTSFHDIAALVALYRPGPMGANMHYDYADRKNGRQKISMLHEEMAPILKDTYGLMIYQEEMMRVAQKFAGYSLEEADNLRKACGKKVREVMKVEREKFVSGVANEGYGEKLGTDLFNMIEPFADYAFNKSHAYGYGWIAWQTAYLKAHYPAEYLAALLTAVSDNQEKAAVYLHDARQHGIVVQTPNINTSRAEFHVKNGEIIFGLTAVRNVGSGVVQQIVQEREKNGPYEDFYDFCARVDPSVLNKKFMEALIKAGAFESLSVPRKGLLVSFEAIVKQANGHKKEEAAGVLSLFADSEVFDDKPPIPDREFTKEELLKLEKEVLGLYVSGHPLMGAVDALRKVTDTSILELPETESGTVVTVGGSITAITKKITKKSGEPMAIITLEDLESSVEVIIFPRTYAKVAHKLVEDGIVTIRGRVEVTDEQTKIFADDIRPVSVISADNSCIHVGIRNELSTELTDGLKALFAKYPGPANIELHLPRKIMKLPAEYSITPSVEFARELSLLLN